MHDFNSDVGIATLSGKGDSISGTYEFDKKNRSTKITLSKNGGTVEGVLKGKNNQMVSLEGTINGKSPFIALMKGDN